MNKFQNRVKKTREGLGLSQTGLAARANIGLSTLNRIEVWHFPVSPPTAKRLAGALDCEVGEVFPYLKADRVTR
jgi:ribosome-binding protein aMBF1 (putative translation factor)